MNTTSRFSPLNSDAPADAGRRTLLKTGAGLTLAVMAGPLVTACADHKFVATGAQFASGNFLRVSDDGLVTIICRNAEIGQGVFTGIATLVAEELDADWSKVVVEAAPADPTRYANPGFGMQGTGGSNSIASSYEEMRKVGATARAMLVAAAAQQWKVSADSITVSKGVLSSGSPKGCFGEFVAAAAKLEVPKDVVLKDPKNFTLIGTPVQRIDSLAKSTGTATYTQDVKLPGMLVAVVIAPPRFGSTVKSFDATAAKSMAGVSDVVQFKTSVREGVAVLASDYWSAKQARDAVKVVWDDSKAEKRSSAQIFDSYKALAAKAGEEAFKSGDAPKALAAASKHFEATYEFPYLAHSAMEPLNCVAQVTETGCEMWFGAQLQTIDQSMVAAALGLKPEQVKINTLYAGGSFGRRSNPMADFTQEAAVIAKTGGNGKPVKLVWSREDDTHGGFYRPMFLHTIKAGVDAQGNITGWQQRIVGQSLLAGTPMAAMMGKSKIDPLSVEGTGANFPYAIANRLVDLHSPTSPVTVQWWRSVGSTHTAYAIECFLDDIARGTKQDPVALRRSLLANQPKHLAVLNLAAEKAGWGQALPAGHAHGVAVHECFGSVAAHVVQVSQDKDGKFKVERVVSAVNVGLAINPNIVAMQVESAIGLGLGAAISGAITLKDGVVEQSNFNNYQVLRMHQMPAVEVHIVPSDEKPTGIGEPGLPPIAPAVANAIAVLTGKPLHTLPFSKSGAIFA